MVDQFPPFKQRVVILALPVANSCPIGQVKVTTVPKAVSRFEASAPTPGWSSGQSKIKINVVSYALAYLWSV